MKKPGGVITSKEVRDSNIPTIYFTRTAETGEIIRADIGIYILSDGDYGKGWF